ncbi:hypothetical protein E2562_019328 [Oryza meyeriana var. granulata]|uniref:Uncharacterized protein n=1 Tax=Oryza meyeriana var. granulata TaxID=110450 RepID=A0A6G1C6K3_9ORYZ|nr:hypothetical protein E2562_019328 [Oryza meyeriana var. granulata]
MASSTLSTALSSMEVMLDALMQRGIGKPEEKPKEEAPPALPTRPTVRGRLPSLQRPGALSPWVHQSPPLPPQEEEEKCAVNLELERRAMLAEEAAQQKDGVVRQKDDEIAALRQQVEHYESRLLECEARMKSVEEELQKQITTLQMAQSNAGRTGGSTTRHRQELSGSGGAPAQSSGRRSEETSVMQQQPRGCEAIVAVAVDERQTEAVSRLATELQRESEAFEHGARAATEARPPNAKSVDELRRLKRQFGAWKKEYEARLRKTKAELKKLVRSSERSGHGNRRRCSSWKIKVPKCRLPKCCAFKLPSPSSCCFCCCFRRYC